MIAKKTKSAKVKAAARSKARQRPNPALGRSVPLHHAGRLSRTSLESPFPLVRPTILTISPMVSLGAASLETDERGALAVANKYFVPTDRRNMHLDLLN
jgi:hypothetical protein